MTLSRTLTLYIGRQFLFWFFSLLLLLTAIIMLAEFVDLMRRSAGVEAIGLGLVMRFTLLKTPQTIQQLFHFTVLFSAMFTFWRLTRSQELVVVRAAGVSAWQFLLPVILLAALLGVAKMAVVNPVGAALHATFERMEDRYFHGRDSLLKLSGSGIWLRQRDDSGVAVIYAPRTAADAVLLERVTIFQFDPEERFVARIDADTALLRDGYWEIRGATLRHRDSRPQLLPQYRLPTSLTEDRIVESFASPETISFWDLPDFIRSMEAAGFSPTRHRLHYHALLSQPLLLAAMVLFAAAFSTRHTRQGHTLAMIVAGIATGFLLFGMSDFVLALGMTGALPTLLAAWSPAGLAALIGCALILYQEDG